MSPPLKRLVFLFCGLGVMFLAGWEAANVRETFRETSQQEVRAVGSEAPKVALTFDDDVIIGLSQEISYKEAVSMI